MDAFIINNLHTSHMILSVIAAHVSLLTTNSDGISLKGNIGRISRVRSTVCESDGPRSFLCGRSAKHNKGLVERRKWEHVPVGAAQEHLPRPFSDTWKQWLWAFRVSRLCSVFFFFLNLNLIKFIMLSHCVQGVFVICSLCFVKVKQVRGSCCITVSYSIPFICTGVQARWILTWASRLVGIMTIHIHIARGGRVVVWFKSVLA